MNNKPQPTKAQKTWMELGYGMFVHFGPNTFAGVGWGNGRFPPERFNPKRLNVQQWAEVAVEAGMKYAVLTAKHHDGFCLWPSQYTEYSVRNCPNEGDIIGSFTDAFREMGLRVGLYYSLWDRNYPCYEEDDTYFGYMLNQITELLTGYGDILELFFDGAWDKDHPTREWPYQPEWEIDSDSGLGHGERWHWRELYHSIHRLQPNCLVINNSSSDRPGWVKYHPVDVRTSEHFDFVWKGKICHPILNPTFENEKGEKIYLPLEYCTSLNPDWFWIDERYFCHPSVETICGWYQTARKSDSNLLLNVGPDKDGLIPEYHRHYLTLAAKELLGNK